MATLLDTGYGKRFLTLDIASPGGKAQFESLVRGCDVFVQAYRPGAIAALGFSPERVASMRPGIVYASLNAFGYTGAWRTRRGFDTVVQAASGMAYLLVALERRAAEGGSSAVNVSLARTSEWMTAMGLLTRAWWTRRRPNSPTTNSSAG